MIHKHIDNPDKSASKARRIGALLTHIARPGGGARCLEFALSPSFLCRDLEGAILEMTANADGAVRSPDTIQHSLFSWRAGEEPTVAQAADAVSIFIRHIGFEDHLYAWALHADTRNRHLHVILDRATADGRVRKVNRGFTQVAGAEAIALIESAQGWHPEENAMFMVLEDDGTLVRSSSQRDRSDLAPAPPQHVVDKALQDGTETDIERIQRQLGDLFLSVGSWRALHDALGHMGLRYATQGRGGLIWVDEIDAVKASSVSRHAALPRLEARLGPFVPPGVAPVPVAAPAYATAVSQSSIASAFDAYHAVVAADRYRVTALRMDPVTGKRLALILDRRAGETYGLTVRDLRARFSEIARLDSRDENIYLTPLSTSFHHLVVDDLSAGNLSALEAEGVQPAAILESSPGNFQAVVVVPRIAPDDVDRRAANAVVRDLNIRFGDPNFSGAVHPHRFPGTRNQKPKHGRPDGFPLVRIVSAEARLCPVTADRLRAAYDGLVGKEQRRRPPTPAVTGRSVAAVTNAEALAIYTAHRRHVLHLFKGADDLSRLDSMIADRLVATGLSESEVSDVIVAGLCAAPGRTLKHTRPEDYARRTVAHAFDPDWRGRCADKFGEHFAEWQAITDAAAQKSGSFSKKEQGHG